MNLGSKGIELIKKYEGCRLKAYKAVPTEVYFTIGWGHYGADVKEGQVISQEQADKMFLEDVKVYSNAVNQYQDKYNFTQNQFDALTSFAYNCGIGALGNVMSVCNTKTQIAEECKLYNKGGGAVLEGLVKRREEEYKLFVKDIKNTTYIIQKGDTLSNIALKHNTTVEKILELNEIPNANLIYPGQVLKLDAAENKTIYHTVVSGEFLGIIASRYNVTVASICRLNNISNPDLIYAGQKLKIK